MRKLRITILCMLIIPAMTYAQKKHRKTEIISLIDSVQTTWQAQNSYRHDAWWDEAMYHTANMEVYRLTLNSDYLDYSTRWAVHNKWKGALEPDKNKWEYKRPLNIHSNVMFADWQICFQTYLDLYAIDPEPQKIARAHEVMDYQISLPKNDFWYWCDALYMCMPVMTRLYKQTGNTIYLQKLYEWIQYTDNVMYDKETGLYFRDRKYVYPHFKSINGKKEFWSRGNGWVIAGLARVLTDLPKDWEHYDFFLQKYIRMAHAIKERQHADGYWPQNIEDHAEMPSCETSGTGLYTYALAWGINNKILDQKEFAPTIESAWEYLQNVALLKNHHIGYVQDRGEKAIPNRRITEKNQTNFGTGCWLLAAVEYCKFLKKK